jgi:hypothetical protein
MSPFSRFRDTSRRFVAGNDTIGLEQFLPLFVGRRRVGERPRDYPIPYQDHVSVILDRFRDEVVHTAEAAITLTNRGKNRSGVRTIRGCWLSRKSTIRPAYSLSITASGAKSGAPMDSPARVKPLRIETAYDADAPAQAGIFPPTTFFHS